MNFQVLKEAFARYEKHEIFLAFNGGKDCTVLLHLLSDHLKEATSDLKVIYLRSVDPFPEIEEFVKFCETYYGISIITVESNTSMKQVLASICEKDKEIRACIMGSRRSDPFCEKLRNFHVDDLKRMYDGMHVNEMFRSSRLIEGGPNL